jgi:uncharacterized lipoprotein YddW (UPF0748 family)
MIATKDGEKKTIDFVNPVFTASGGAIQSKNSISLFSTGNKAFVSEGTIKTNVAVVVDSKMNVVEVINKSVNGAKPSFSEPTDVMPPEGGFVLLAYDDSYGTAGFKSFLATKFQVGDSVKLYNGDVEISLEEALNSYPVEVPEGGNNNQTDFTYTLENLVVETAFDPNFGSTGETKTIDFVNPDFSGPVAVKDSISIFTYGNRPYVSSTSITTNVAVVVDKNMTVIRVINQSINGGKPSFTESTDVAVPEGGFILLACDGSYATAGYKSFLATKFKAGDAIKLKVNEKTVTAAEILQLTGQNGNIKKHATLSVTQEGMQTITENSFTISGKVNNLEDGVTYSVRVDQINNGQEYMAEVQADGTYTLTVPVAQGANYYDVTLIENGVDYSESTKNVIVFQRVRTSENKPVILWIDQFASVKNLNTVEKIQKMMANAKRAGITALAFDVKGVEGYVSYKKATVTNAPYMTETTNPNKIVSMDIDFLEEMLAEAHANGIKLYASLNFFTEGNIATNDSALDIAKNHPDWAEVFQTPEDKGELKSILKSSRKSTLLFVNPGNEEVRAHELGLVQEVLENYAVDGIILDRARYDNQYADFSDLSKEQFEAYLKGKGKTLQNWPGDAFKINADGSMLTGQHYLEWLAYRSTVIESFVSELKTLMNQYEASQNRNIDLAAYVGSWYESYYQNGVNWADSSFEYNKRLGFPMEELYAKEFEYSKTSYIKHIDFIMTGCYYTTEALMQKYTTLNNILINNKIPFYASIDLTNLAEAPDQRMIFQAAYQHSEGSMIFDLCFVDWDKIRCAIADTQYKNSAVMGVYNPKTKDSLTIDNIDTARAEDKLTIYTDAYGTSTGTNQWGVEVVVDAKGNVTELKNQRQAANWDWATPENNDSSIPVGGFVLSTVDRSGSRVYRQLLANSFQVGDKVAAAILTGFVDYEEKVYTSSTADIEVKVQTFGQDQNTVVKIGEIEATAKEGNNYLAKVNLSNGVNLIPITIYVDGLKVLEKTISITATLTPVTPTVTPPVTEPSENGNGNGNGKDKNDDKNVVIDDKMLNNISISNSILKLYVGGNKDTERQLKVNLPNSILKLEKDKKATVEVTYQSSNPKVAKVGKDGNVTAVAVGKAVITTTVTVNDKTTTFETEVNVLKASIKIVYGESTIKVGTKVTAHCMASGYDISKIQWGTTKKKIAVVGKNTGNQKVNVSTQSAGKDVIIVYVMNGKEKVVLAEKDITIVK